MGKASWNKDKIRNAGKKLAAVFDLNPLGLIENQNGIASYAKAVFETDQSVPVVIRVNSKSFLPS